MARRCNLVGTEDLLATLGFGGVTLQQVVNRLREEVRLATAAASRVILAELACEPVAYLGLEEALAEDDTQVLLFGKAEARPQRRMGVVLAGGTSPEQARERADRAAARIAVVKGA